MFLSILEQVNQRDEDNETPVHSLVEIAEVSHDYGNGIDIVENALLMKFSPTADLPEHLEENAVLHQDIVEDSMLSEDASEEVSDEELEAAEAEADAELADCGDGDDDDDSDEDSDGGDDTDYEEDSEEDEFFFS